MILGWNRAVEAGLIPDGAEIQAVRFSSDTTADTYKEQIDWADVLIFNSEIGKAERLNGGVTETQKACGPNLVAGMEAILGVANPTGKLSVDIPVFESGSFTDEICFPRGYGLSYS